MRELEPEEQSWNIKKIILGVFVLALLIGGGIYLKDLIDKYNHPIPSQKQSNTLGVSTKNQDEQIDSTIEPTIGLPSKQQIANSVANEINALKQQALSLSPQDIASSSPQVQKILNDLKAIQHLPQSQAKQFCENICKSL